MSPHLVKKSTMSRSFDIGDNPNTANRREGRGLSCLKMHTKSHIRQPFRRPIGSDCLLQTSLRRNEGYGATSTPRLQSSLNSTKLKFKKCSKMRKFEDFLGFSVLKYRFFCKNFKDESKLPKSGVNFNNLSGFFIKTLKMEL